MSDFHPDSIRNDTDSKTLSRLVMIRTRDSDLVILLNAIQTACKLVARSVRKAGNLKLLLVYMVQLVVKIQLVIHKRN